MRKSIDVAIQHIVLQVRAKTAVRGSRAGSFLSAYLRRFSLGSTLCSVPALLVLAMASPSTAQPGTSSLDPKQVRLASLRPDTASGRPDWRWRQVLSTQSIGSRLTAITVDPDDPRRIFVGTEEGRILLTEDTGVTWSALETNPFNVEDRELMLIAPGLPELGGATPSPLRIFYDPPEARYIDRVFVTGVQLVQFSTFPSSLVVGFIPVGVGVPQDLLALASRSRRAETEPVRRIAVCPGNIYSLLVASKYDLYGSSDGGTSYVRLFGIPGVELSHVVCSPNDPQQVYVSTGFGLFRSLDGGRSFDQLLVGWPGAPATAIALPPGEEGESQKLFAAWGSQLWVGDPDSDAGLELLYPDYGNTDTAPWSDIRWIDVTRRGSVWMATDDGIRVSLDGSTSWKALARSLFEREPSRQILVGPNEDGGERVAVVLGGWVYSSDDKGANWHPFFHGTTRRDFKQMAVSYGRGDSPPGWWIVTAGSVWTTVPPERPFDPEAEPYRRWARERLASTPPMGQVQEKVLSTLRLSAGQISKFNRSARRRNFAPIFSMLFTHNSRPVTVNQVGVRSNLLISNRNTADKNWELYAQLYWTLKGLMMADEEYNVFQNRITDLRNQVRFVVEDSWRERYLLLQRIANGETDAVQAASLKERILGLEAIIEIWMREPLNGKGQRHG